jgi:hypothetical protein
VAIMATASGDSKTFDPAPAGVHQGVCVDVVDLGILDVTWQGQSKKQHKINVAWQIAELREDGKPFLVFKRYTLSLSEKANLRKDLESWRGRAFTREEEMGFDVESVIGANCLLNIQHNESGGKTYANVVSIMPLVKGMPKMTAAEYVRKKDRTEGTEARHISDEEMGQSRTDITDDDIPF